MVHGWEQSEESTVERMLRIQELAALMVAHSPESGQMSQTEQCGKSKSGTWFIAWTTDSTCPESGL